MPESNEAATTIAMTYTKPIPPTPEMEILAHRFHGHAELAQAEEKAGNIEAAAAHHAEVDRVGKLYDEALAVFAASNQ